MKKRALKVFLCHASDDKNVVRKLYKRLLKSGFDPWFDEEKLIAGQEWGIEIPKAVENSDVIIICLSNNSVTKEGYIQKEISFALDKSDEKPEGVIYLIPLKLEECQVPRRLEKWQWVNYFTENGFDELLKALKTRSENLGLIVDEIHVDLVCSPWSDLPGSEIAIRFFPKNHPNKVSKVRFYIAKSGKPWTQFEVRFYESEGKIPGRRINTETIVGAGKLGSEWAEIDLAAYDVIIEDDEFFMSMYWKTAPGPKGQDAQFLGAKHTRDTLIDRNYFWFPQRNEWVVENDRCCYAEIEFENGSTLKSYL
jgi:hypothetical protein